MESKQTPASSPKEATEPIAAAPHPSEAQYRLLVECSPYCIHQIDTEGCLSAMNAAGLKMLGVEDEGAIVGMPYLEAIAQEDRERVAQLMEAAYQGRSSNFEFVAANGREFASSFVPLFDNRERVFGLMGLTQDVTEQKRDARALKESERRLELALQGADLGIWEWNLQNRCLQASDRLLAMLGYRPGELEPLLESIRDLIHPEDRERVEMGVKDHLDGRLPYIESEHRMRAVDGSWKWVLNRGKVVEVDGEGKAVRVTGTTLDVDQRYRARSRRRELEERLQQAQKMDSVGQLAGGIAHDFNNLIQVILGNLELAERALKQGDSPRAAMANMTKATEQAAKLTRRLLTFSRKQAVVRRALDLNQLVASMMNMLTRVVPENIDVQFDRGPAPLPVMGDAGQIEQALLNLCVNARDAMPKGGQLLLSTCAIEDEEGAWVRLTVADTGAGMSAEVRQRAFEPFFSTKQPQGGTGLGLAMVYGITQQNQGRIRIDSQPGVGTRVSVEFPVTEEKIAPRDEDLPIARISGTGIVLVVEDERMLRDLLFQLLQSEGYEVLTAVDGTDALETFAKHEDIDLVLIDAIMPNMDGREAAAAMLRLRPEVKILFTSGYHDGSLLSEEFLQRHGLQVLRKPYPVQELLARVRETLEA